VRAEQMERNVVLVMVVSLSIASSSLAAPADRMRRRLHYAMAANPIGHVEVHIGA